MKIVSLFSGVGGLDIGFKKAGHSIIWANDIDSAVFESYITNHRRTMFSKNDIRRVTAKDIPDCDLIIGGPPCQSFSVAGKQLGIQDERGKLFFEYTRIVSEKKPLAFIAENVKGLLSIRHRDAYHRIMSEFIKAEYSVSAILLNAGNYNVPQTRERVFLIGIKKDTNLRFRVPSEVVNKPTLRDTIADLEHSALPAINMCYTNGNQCKIPNHEYLDLPFPYDYGNYDRVRSWDDQSYTIRATGKYALPHPSCPPMRLNKYNRYSFDSNVIESCRRLTIRECARIQTFPDDFVFKYTNLMDGYKMVGNAVPVNLAYYIAKSIT